MPTFNNTMIRSPEVQEKCGKIARATLFRWRHDPALNFPPPTRIRGELYWNPADIDAWWKQQAALAD